MMDTQPWMQTHRGQAFQILDPVPAQVDMTDVAESLAKLCRFNGHTLMFYSVAQHSVLVSQILERDGASPYTPDGRATLLYGLLHDAHEAYVGDITTPVKDALRIACPPMGETLRTITDRIDAAVFEAANLPAVMPAAVAKRIKHADMVALATERRDVLVSDGVWRAPLPTPFPRIIRPQPWPKALDSFVLRLRDLTDGAP